MSKGIDRSALLSDWPMLGLEHFETDPNFWETEAWPIDSLTQCFDCCAGWTSTGSDYQCFECGDACGTVLSRCASIENGVLSQCALGPGECGAGDCGEHRVPCLPGFETRKESR